MGSGTGAALNKILDEYEEWFYDVAGQLTADLLQITVSLKESVHTLCKVYFDAKLAEKRAKEAELEVAARLAMAEKQAAGEDGDGDGDEDHDTRKLKKPERLRMVVKNKEEGTELYKGGNIRPAAARYQKALTHACMLTLRYWVYMCDKQNVY